MKELSNDEMKKVMGGVLAPPPPHPESTCSVQCSNGEWKDRDCGSGSTCSSTGTKIACNTETTGKEMCPTNQ
jgi:bacteriocin-like protein